MNEHITQTKCTEQRFAKYIRFSLEEYTQLEDDVRRTGKNAQDLLKKAYFGKGRIITLMPDEDKDRFFTEIRRIGNNVNQIAKKLNSGVLDDSTQSIESIRAQLTLLQAWMTARYRAYRA